MPKVSVLMPVYKTKEQYLREAIESILNQSYKDFEFLILDDCPADSREAVVSSYKDKRIKYSKNEKNLGITPSRNKLIEMAEGEYLAVFDHDDISTPDRLEKQVQYLDEHPEVGVLSCQVENYPSGYVSKQLTNDESIRLALMSQCAVNHPASMIRRSVLIENNIRYREEFTPAEDYALWCSLIPYTKFHNLSEVLFKWRNHQTNTSKVQKNKMDMAKIKLQAELKTKFPALYDEFLQKSIQKKQFNLFGVIPLIRLVHRDRETKIYLFNKILLATYKTSLKIKDH